MSEELSERELSDRLIVLIFEVAQHYWGAQKATYWTHACVQVAQTDQPRASSALCSFLNVTPDLADLAGIDCQYPMVHHLGRDRQRCAEILDAKLQKIVDAYYSVVDRSKLETDLSLLES